MRSSPREKASRGRKTSKARRSKTAKLRILVVEDNPSNQRVVSSMLESEGLVPDMAHNGLEALEMMEHHGYDVVFLDVQMPGMDGLETVREVRQRWPRTRPRLIALTASATKQDRARCLDAGMDGFLPKPVALDAMLDVLRHAPRRAS